MMRHFFFLKQVMRNGDKKAEILCRVQNCVFVYNIVNISSILTKKVSDENMTQ